MEIDPSLMKVKTNRKAVGAWDVEEAVMNALKEHNEKETRRNTIAVQCH